MKKNSLLLIILSIACFSCKHTLECDKEPIKVVFVGYSQNEIDSTFVVRFEKDGNFSVIVDTVKKMYPVSNTLSNDSITMQIPNVKNTGGNSSVMYDVQLINPKIGIEIKLSETNYHINTYTEGFSMDHFANSCISDLISFKKDSQIITGNQFYIIK